MNLIDPEILSVALRDHVKNHPSAFLVASTATAFESWFRVELAVTLLNHGYKREDLKFNYTYPSNEIKSNAKADIALGKSELPIVFELKPFVKGEDSNKRQAFLLQVALLALCYQEEKIAQGVAFLTFIGYSDKQVANMIKEFFHESWEISGSHFLVDGHPLLFVIAVTAEQANPSQSLTDETSLIETSGVRGPK